MDTDTQLLLMQQKLEDHILDFHEHCAAEEKRWSHLIETQQHNTECIRELTQSTRELTASTKDIVVAWNAASGTMRTLAALGKFARWLAGLAVLGTAINWLVSHIPK